MDRDYWSPVVDRWLTDLASSFLERQLDVRENVKFAGGHLGRTHTFLNN